jgi:3'-phosphoadenosine 5'-phosphosulfate sulfotransferase (PAPS reductase)/FAD synthetase
MVNRCVSKNKITVNPMIDFSDEDVWKFIREHDLPVCGLYALRGFSRLGCLACPMAGIEKRFKQLDRYPHAFKFWLYMIRKTLPTVNQRRIENGDEPFKSDYEFYYYWLVNKKIMSNKYKLWRMNVTKDYKGLFD